MQDISKTCHPPASSSDTDTTTNADASSFDEVFKYYTALGGLQYLLRLNTPTSAAVLSAMSKSTPSFRSSLISNLPSLLPNLMPQQRPFMNLCSLRTILSLTFHCQQESTALLLKHDVLSTIVQHFIADGKELDGERATRLDLCLRCVGKLLEEQHEEVCSR